MVDTICLAGDANHSGPPELVYEAVTGVLSIIVHVVIPMDLRPLVSHLDSYSAFGSSIYPFYFCIVLGVIVSNTTDDV